MTAATPTESDSPRRQPGIAPRHVGERLWVVLLGTAIIAVGLLIVAITVIVGGITQASRFAGGEPPPNVDELGRVQILAGIGLLLVSMTQIVLPAVILVLDWRPARPLSAVVDGLMGVVAIYVGLLVLTAGPAPDVVVALALLAIGAFFLAAMVVHVVQLRRGLHRE